MYTLGMDLGGTKIATAVVDEEGQIVAHLEVPTLSENGPAAVIASMADAARAVLAEATSMGVSESMVQAVGVGAPGPLNPKTGIVSGPPNLPGWRHVALREELEQQLGMPVTLDNDANAATLAEATVGAGKGVRDLVYITVSTGIGGGVMLDGKVRQGHSGGAAEIGHHVIDRNGPLCQCGNRGCLETLASGTAIARLAQERLGRALDAKTVAQLAAKGDPGAEDLMRDVYDALGVGLVNVVNLFDPALIIIGGGVAQIGDVMFTALQDAVDHNGFRSAQTSRVRVVPAQLGTRAGVIGAALLPRESRRVTE